MKTICVVAFVFVLSFTAAAQGRREAREARREQRRIERAVRDSLRMLEFENDSVNIGYGYIRKKSLTTSVSGVDVKDDEIATYSDIGEYLMGRVPGLVVTRYGNSYKYAVRGINSINSGTDPLFIVDGSAVDDISFLNPRDVKSVQVLKDASASIYGTRGACGVILITTKK